MRKLPPQLWETPQRAAEATWRVNTHLKALTSAVAVRTCGGLPNCVHAK